MGPVEVLAVEFPGNQQKREVALALGDLVQKGFIRVIDLVFIRKDPNGDVIGIELNETDFETGVTYDSVTDDISGLISPEDIQEIGKEMEPDSSTVLFVVEHLWATSFQQAVLQANGRLAAHIRIPADVVDEALAARPAGI